MILMVLAATEWIEQLGDEDWRVREAATEGLIELGDVDAVRPALESPDPEVRARAQHIVDCLSWNLGMVPFAYGDVPRWLPGFDAELTRLADALEPYGLDADVRRVVEQFRAWSAEVEETHSLG